jgi:hypothetical protein
MAATITAATTPVSAPAPVSDALQWKGRGSDYRLEYNRTFR